MNKRYVDNDGNFWNGKSIVIGEKRIWNPTEEQLMEAGYTEFVKPEPTTEQLLAQAKSAKLAAIESYDRSASVNIFTVRLKHDGDVVKEIETWADRETRADYKASIEAAELLGRDVVSPVMGGVELAIPVQTAKVALAQVQIYANQCYNVTEQKLALVRGMETVEAVEAVDVTSGYPEKLVFELDV